MMNLCKKIYMYMCVRIDLGGERKHMKYVITKGNSYLYRKDGSYAITSKLCDIEFFDSLESGEEHLCLAKGKGVVSKGWSVMPSPFEKSETSDADNSDTDNDINSIIASMPQKGFCICGENDFIGVDGSNGLIFTKDVSLVKVYKHKQDAHNGLVSLVKKNTWMTGYRVLPYDKESFETNTIDGKYNDASAFNSQDHVFSNRELNTEIDGIFSQFIKEYNEKLRQCTEKQSMLENKLLDIQHLIEFSEFDKSDENVYKLYLLMRQTLRERRDAKDDFTKLKQMNNAISSMNKTLIKFKSMVVRTYKPRSGIDLFKEMENSGMIVNPSFDYLKDKRKDLTPELKPEKVVSTKPISKPSNKVVRKKTFKKGILARVIKSCENSYSSLLHNTSSNAKRARI